eukprot:scaffold22614_cov33-Phaeocystis_antarctica.AAC.1
MASRTQTDDGSLLRVPQEVPAAHMTASLRPSGPHAIRLPWAAKGAMKTSRPVDARLWAAGEDPGLQSELGAEYTRPYGDCHEHAARFDRPQAIGEGPGLIRTLFIEATARAGPRWHGRWAPERNWGVI